MNSKTQNKEIYNHLNVIIVGAGMSGCLMGILLAQKKIKSNITIYEERNDIRNIPLSTDRSINQSLSERGIHALRKAKLWKKVKGLTILQKGRLLHQQDKVRVFQPYGKNIREVQRSINRNELNKLLLNEASSLPNLTIVFNTRCLSVDKKEKTISFKNFTTGKVFRKKADLIFGADGVNSIVRTEMQRNEQCHHRAEYLDWGYKNLYIPVGNNNNPPLEKHMFHMWPREKSAIFGIPNKNGSFTCTLTLPLYQFGLIKTRRDIYDLFKNYFEDLLPHISTIQNSFLNNRVGSFVTIYTSPWYYKDFMVLLGDSCHCVTIFYGQGINAAFEDCEILSTCIDKFFPNLEKAFSTYQSLRKENTDMLGELSKQRFIELKDKSRSVFFLAQQDLEHLLSKTIPFWVPLYTLIVHTRLPYIEAVKRYKKQLFIGRLLGMDIAIILLAFYYKIKYLMKRSLE